MVLVGCNGYGRFVDYEFYLEIANHTVIINGPNAQALKGVKHTDWNGLF